MLGASVSVPVSPVCLVLTLSYDPGSPGLMMCGQSKSPIICGQCKWSVIGGWASDKRLPATKRAIRATDDRETGQVDRTSLFLIETEIPGHVW